jgi:hypothetical protein
MIDAHSHVFRRIHGRIAGGPTRGAGLGRMAVGDSQVLQLMPPLSESSQHTTEMLLINLDWAGVDGAVLLQGTFYGECDDYVAEAVQAHPDRLVGALWCDPWREGFRRTFEERTEGGDFRIGKIEFSTGTGLCGVHPGARLDDEEVAWLWPALEGRDMTLTLDLGPPTDPAYQTEAVRAIAERHEGLRVVVAHLCHPRPDEDENDRSRREAQLALGELPNVWFDGASFPAFLAGQEDFPFPTAAAWLREGIDRVGAKKIMWGTDQPGLLGHLTYPQLARLAQLHTAHLSDGERELVLGETALRVYFGR